MTSICKTYIYLIGEIQRATAEGDTETESFYRIILEELEND